MNPDPTAHSMDLAALVTARRIQKEQEQQAKDERQAELDRRLKIQTEILAELFPARVKPLCDLAVSQLSTVGIVARAEYNPALGVVTLQIPGRSISLTPELAFTGSATAERWSVSAQITLPNSPKPLPPETFYGDGELLATFTRENIEHFIQISNP